MGRTPPVLWLLLGPNGAGKSTYYETRVRPRFLTEFVNADVIAKERQLESSPESAYEAARLAADRRQRLIENRASFVAETVGSHPSKLELLRTAKAAGYEVWVSFVYLETADLAVARVARRVRRGGHPVPQDKIRARYARLVPIAVAAVAEADRAYVLDNSDPSRPLRDVLTLERGRVTWTSPDLPDWTVRCFPQASR